MGFHAKIEFKISVDQLTLDLAQKNFMDNQIISIISVSIESSITVKVSHIKRVQRSCNKRVLDFP